MYDSPFLGLAFSDQWKMAEMTLGRTWEEPKGAKTLGYKQESLAAQITQLERGGEGREHHVEEGLVLYTHTHPRDW